MKMRAASRAASTCPFSEIKAQPSRRTSSLKAGAKNGQVVRASPQRHTMSSPLAGASDGCTDGMLVAVRLRPISESETRLGHRKCCKVVGDQAVVIEKFGQPNGHLRSQQAYSKEYAYDVAFPETASQEEVYSKTVKDIVPTILKGYHATIFAYGATGAGKTHTMMGSERDGLGELDDFEDEFEVDGIIPHALADIFRLIRHRNEEESIVNLSNGSAFEWKVLISYLEVYNEQIRDLLQPSSKPLALREDKARGVVHVAGLHHQEAHSAGEVLQLLRHGNRNRKTESTAANKVSSRSHAVIQVTVRQTTTVMMSEANPRTSIVEGRLSLIDLAGSERASTTQNKGMRLTEGANINKSLLALANCINSLTTQNKGMTRRSSLGSPEASSRASLNRFRTTKVQYRDSKLTHLLKNSLEGDCRLVMIANVNPSHTSFDESHNTLKYADRAKSIKIRPKLHVTTASMTYAQRIDTLEKENVHLRAALENAQKEIERMSVPKRKTMPSRDTISPSTMKKFKNLPWGGNSSVGIPVAAKPPPSPQPEKDSDALHAIISRLEEEKAALQDEVVELKASNQALQNKIDKVDCLLKCADEDLPTVPLQALPVPPHPSTLPTYTRPTASLIPRIRHTFSRDQTPKRNQENLSAMMNSSSPSPWLTVKPRQRGKINNQPQTPVSNQQTLTPNSSQGKLRQPSAYYRKPRRESSRW